MLIFRTEEKDYRGASALEVVRKMESDQKDYPFRGQSIGQFLRWSFERLTDRFPPRDLDLSNRMEDEAQALNFLYLCDEYGVGKLSGKFENAPEEIKTIVVHRG